MGSSIVGCAMFVLFEDSILFISYSTLSFGICGFVMNRARSYSIHGKGESKGDQTTTTFFACRLSVCVISIFEYCLFSILTDLRLSEEAKRPLFLSVIVKYKFHNAIAAITIPNSLFVGNWQSPFLSTQSIVIICRLFHWNNPVCQYGWIASRRQTIEILSAMYDRTVVRNDHCSWQ